MKLNLFLVLLTSLAFWSCKPKTESIAVESNLPQGDFLGILEIQGQKLPFEFNIDANAQIFKLKNGDEEFIIDDFKLTNDSILVPMHIFDTELKANWNNDEETFTGTWTKNYVDDYKIPFTASKIEENNNSENEAIGFEPIAKKYRVYFESMLKDSTVSVAEFIQDGNSLNGTFLTTTGDYRFLRGSVYNNELKLFTFDGEHAFVFTGLVDSIGLISGHFYSGKTWHETWAAYPDSTVELEDASSLTYLKDGYETFDFEGINLNGDTFNLNSPEYENKALLIQIMGTWCPNCMDETAFLSNWYNRQKPQNLELVSLAFERKNNFGYAKARLNKLKETYNINYPLLFCGGYDKESAAQVLPSLNKVIAYPTLIFIDKNHKVTHIHTGFSGPGTGHYYEKWKLDFNKQISQLTKD